MNFELPAKDFIALVKCAASVSAKSTVAIVEHALFSGDGTTLSVSATNLEQTATASIPCEARGSFTASVARLSAIAGTLDKSNPVRLSFKAKETSLSMDDPAEGTVTIAQGRSTHRVPTLRASDFPVNLTLPLEDAIIEWEAPAPVLSRSLRDLSLFTDDGKARPYLAGVFFDPEAGMLVATNGQILARDTVEWCRSKRAGFILPDKAVKPICDLIAGHDRVHITANDRAVVFAVEGGRLRTALVDGQFPDYKRIIDYAERSTTARTKSAELAASITRVSAVGADPAGGTSVRVSLFKSEICVDAVGEGENQGVDYCAAELKKGKPVEFGASWKYLRAALDTLEGAEEIDISTHGAESPVIITPAGSEDFLRIVMPVSLGKARAHAEV